MNNFKCKILCFINSSAFTKRAKKEKNLIKKEDNWEKNSTRNKWKILKDKPKKKQKEKFIKMNFCYFKVATDFRLSALVTELFRCF